MTESSDGPRPIPTITEVARRARVSPATVSRVLADNAGVSPALAERVRRAAQALGYQPNALARSLRTGRSQTIGVVVPDIQNPFFTDVIAGVEEVLAAAGYSLLLTNAGESIDRERVHLAKFQAGNAGGILIAPTGSPEAGYADVAAWGIPIVAFSRMHPGLPVDSVTVDNRAGLRRAVRHMAGLGHRRIAFIGGPIARSTGRDRLTGYEDGLQEAGIALDPSLVRLSNFRQNGGFEAMRALLESDSRPTAVIAGNNLMTLGALEAIHSARRIIPDDIALIGFDDMPWAVSLNPPLTAVAQP